MYVNSLTHWINTSPGDDFWPITVVLVAVTVAGFLGAFYFFYKKRIIEDTPTSKVRSAAQGYVELRGIGELMEGPPIIAPLTGSTCTWYEYEIEEHRRSGKNSKWVTIDSGKSTELFLLLDDTGKCVIDPDGASVITSSSDVWYGNSRRPSSGPDVRRGRFSGLNLGKYRYTEKRLSQGETLYAIGLFKTVGGAGGGFNIDVDIRDLLKEWKQDSETLMRKFDKNKDGQRDLEEWENVRNEAFKVVMARHSESESAPPVNVMSKTLDRRRPYMLSAISQEFLIRRYQYLAMGLITLFFVCGAAATWMISVRLAGG